MSISTNYKKNQVEILEFKSILLAAVKIYWKDLIADVS
jgi:hypothetical protein